MSDKSDVDELGEAGPSSKKQKTTHSDDLNDPSEVMHFILPKCIQIRRIETPERNTDEIIKKIEQLDKKIDIINYNCVGVKRLVENLQKSVDKIMKIVMPKTTSMRVEFPLSDDADLNRLEELSKNADVEAELQQKFSSLSNKSAYDLFRVAVQNMFQNTGRHTWSGRTAYNALHEVLAQPAAELHVISILLDTAISKFRIDRNTAVGEFVKALNNFNEAATARKKRNQNQ